MKYLKRYNRIFESESQFEEDKEIIGSLLFDLTDYDVFNSRFDILSFPIEVDSGYERLLTIGGGEHYLLLSTSSKQKRNFKFSDIKIPILNIKDYLDKRWIRCVVLFEGETTRVIVDVDKDSYDHLDNYWQTKITEIVIFFQIK